MTAVPQAHTFRPRDLVGGHVVLDLVNTVTARNAEPADWLDGYPRLLEWAALTGRFSPAALTELVATAGADPGTEARALDRVRELREALHALVTALVHDDTPAPAVAVGRVEKQWKQAVARSRLVLDGNIPRLDIGLDASGLDYPAHVLALEALELLRSWPADRVRVCPGGRCGWVFLDSSRGGRRRWCSMATCGNSAKGRTHYRRKQRPEDPRDPAASPTGT
ncbi:CGNR zinc finger domain-containing protein [Streptomyces laurentii]|uniref:CGNR zinc finger domain-containing protein n=1 Tax=Streptomyces laurentii TaxID=39478 RepID=UPI0033DE9DE1